MKEMFVGASRKIRKVALNFSHPDSPPLARSAVRFGSLVLVLDALCAGFLLPLRYFARFDSPPFVDHLAQMESPVSIDGLMHVGSSVFVHSFLCLDSLLLVYGICLLEFPVLIADLFVRLGAFTAIFCRIGSSTAEFSRIQYGLFPCLLDFIHFELSLPVRSLCRWDRFCCVPELSEVTHPCWSLPWRFWVRFL